MIALLLAFAALAGVKPTPVEGLDAAYAPRRIAMLVGVDDYADPALQTLSFAGKDADDLAAVLMDPAIGGYDEVVVVTGAEATTRAGIVHAIERVTADLQRDDTFLLYLSGHGTLDLDAIRGTRLYFLPSDGELAEPVETALEVAWLERTLTQLEPRRRVLVLDTCHNGRSKSGLSGSTASRLRQLRGDPPPPSSVSAVSESEARLYAAQYYQPAMEDPDLENGVYTHFLIEALTSGRDAADLDRDGLVDVVEAHDYARDGTIRYTGGLQVPRAEYRIVGHEEIYLAGDPSRRRTAEQALISAYDGLLTSARLLIDGTPRGQLPAVVAVDPGVRHLEVRTSDGHTLVSRRVRVVAGEITSIEDLLGQRPDGSWWVLTGGYGLHGPAAVHTVPFGMEAELGRAFASPPGLATAAWVRAGFADGLVEEITALGGGRVAAGQLGAGAFVGWAPGPGWVAVGPEAELAFPWRAYDLGGAAHRQGAGTVAPGLRLQASPRLSATTALVIRYDVRVVPWRHDAAWTTAVTHGLGVGVATR